MSNLNSVELTEEDAADLQFPKETQIICKLNNEIKCCGNCENELSDKHILCAECNATICVHCFSNGAEFGNHKNDHSYKVINVDFPLFDGSTWTAKEEQILLNGLLVHGNWQRISKELNNYPVNKIKQHYDHFYLQRMGSDEFPLIESSVYKEPLMPYRFKIKDAYNPIRLDEPGTSAGYNAPRSDFDLDYDPTAEDMISEMDFKPEDKLINDLQIAILNIYRRRVSERERRKAIIREHGLILPQKTKSWLQRYANTVTPAVCDKLVRFMQFYTGQGFVYTMEGLHRVGQLKIQIIRLMELRKLGIKTMDEANLYLRLNRHREESLKELKKFQQDSSLKFTTNDTSLLLANRRRKPPPGPLDILALPNYDKLLNSERELCRNIRITPTNYLTMKQILVSEHQKLGYLKLYTARRLLKIDVNKTRKLYDYLVAEGHIVQNVDP